MSSAVSPVGSRCHFGNPLERTVEMGHTLEAAGHGNLLDRAAGLQQAVLGGKNPFGRNVIRHIHPQTLLKDPAEVGRRDRRPPCQRGQLQRLIQVIVDIAERLTEPVRQQGA